MVGICVCEGGGVFGREMGQWGYHGPLDQGLHCSVLPSSPFPRLVVRYVHYQLVMTTSLTTGINFEAIYMV